MKVTCVCGRFLYEEPPYHATNAPRYELCEDCKKRSHQGTLFSKMCPNCGKILERGWERGEPVERVEFEVCRDCLKQANDEAMHEESG